MGYIKGITEMENLLGERIIFPDEIIGKLENNNALPEAMAAESEIRNINEPVNVKIKKPRESRRKTTIIIGSVAATVLVVLAIFAIFYAPQGTLTGYTTATREVQEAIDYNKEFSHYTETQLDITNLTGLRISGALEGTRAIVKLRINDVEYTVADITKPQDSLITGMVVGEELSHTISTDKGIYVLGETVTITITPDAENKSIYVTRGEETAKLDGNTYLPAAAGEYTAIALIVLADDILRVETNFTFIEQTAEEANETNQTNTTETPTEPEPTPEPTIPAGYEFTNLCTETCNLAGVSNPVLIIELEPNTTLTITELIITRTKENSAPEQTKNIPDIILAAGQTIALELDDYFTDPDGDTVQYDINEIPEIGSTIAQSTLSISSENTGAYTAYIYATDGDKLVTSNIFLITITSNETKATEPAINATLVETSDLCSSPNINQRPAYCFEGIEDQVFQDILAPLETPAGIMIGRFNRFGNLIIKGLLIQNSTGTPGESDFKIGYSETRLFTEVRTYTAWIDSETGNLHLRGRIYEEQQSITPPQSPVYLIQNKLGIVLGYFDRLTGDLYLKGNIVQLGKV
ncbi:MAG TPA: hypothetical protein VJ461_03660 [Candidatus Nanoarchaeia archaeon]|nr:hypothetical protein [Candidatus Nanoarchaeia archaeon]